MATPQPAKKSYFFGKGYRELKNVVKGAWGNNASTARHFGLKIKIVIKTGNIIFKWFQALFYIFATISMYIFGTAFCLLFTLIHALILVSVTTIIYISFSTIWLADRLYLMFHRVFGACPKCKEKFLIPVYVCKCGAEHTKLTPSAYGILKRKCNCGEKMPTTIFQGRRYLKAKCPMCGHIIETKEAVPVCVSVLGGPSVGKTCYITATMKELIENVSPLTSMTVDFYDHRNQIECNQMIAKYNQGTLQKKTSELNPTAFNFFLKGKGLVPERLLYLFDIAGEAFSTFEALSTQKQYQYCHGFIFIIDPLSIPDICNEYYETSDYKLFGASIEDTNDTFDVFLNNLKRISGLNANQLSKVPCAIVVNKVDAFDLESKLGEEPAKCLLNNPENKYKTIDAAISELTKNYLIQHGMNNFVQNMELSFKKNRYFSCSSLGHLPNGTSFIPIRVLAPFSWIVSQLDSKLKKRFDRYANNGIMVNNPQQKNLDTCNL